MFFPIDIIQFHRPNGKQENVIVAIDDLYKLKYKRIRELGLRFTVEVLNARQISVCLEEPELGDMLIEITSMNTSVVEPIEKMLNEWTEEKYAKWSRNMIEAEGATWND